MRRWYAFAAVAGLVLAACSGGSDSGSAAARRATPVRSASDSSAKPDDAPPDQVPAVPGGAIGYSPYVFESDGQNVVTSLVEGPRGKQVRCQDPKLPCSYEELRKLAASGKPVPKQLHMSRSELDTLVGQLDEVHAAVEHYRDVNVACAEGFSRSTDQVPNMGAHFLNQARVEDGAFIPSEPEMLLYVTADDQLPQPGTSGQCRRGHWEGSPMKISGVAFVLPSDKVGDNHPDGFAGPLDNWHMHYDLCSGPSVGHGSRTLNPDACRAEGGVYLPKYGWMIHAWVDPQHDDQLGVFSMWNPTIAPVTNLSAIHTDRSRAPKDLPPGAAFSAINNFRFDSPIKVKAGSSVVFSNADSVTHTVTAGSPGHPDKAFDSGQIPPGQTFELDLKKPGTYTFYCSLHPQMTGRVVVK